MEDPTIIFRAHAFRRMIARGITELEVRAVLETHDLIEVYPEDLPHPSKLILGWFDQRPLHIVASFPDVDTIVVITAYEPTLNDWELGFRRRKIK